MGILGVPRAFCYAVGATYVTKYFLPPKCRHAFCQVERAHPPPEVCGVQRLSPSANSTMWVMSGNGFDHDGDGDEGYGNGDDVRTWRVTIAISALPATSRSAVSRLTPWPA